MNRATSWLAGSLGCVALLASSCQKSMQTARDAAADGAAAAAVQGSHEETAIAIAPRALASDASTSRASLARTRAMAKADETIAIPAGSFRAGSTPGDVGRDPATEPVVYDAAIVSYEIDALPFPNDPAKPAKIASSASEAAKLCEASGKRLCSEIEWEHACKGGDDDPYATGASWDAACDRDPSTCASAFGVRALGATRELTSSRFAGAGGTVIRGGISHRCSARVRDGLTSGAFRCCSGGANDTPMPAIDASALPPFRPADIDPPHLARILTGAPELARIAGPIRFFDVAEITKRRDGGSGLRAGLTLTASPILWSPSAGMELLVATGRSATSSFVVAFWRVADDAYRLAASLLFDEDEAPVALVYDPSQRKDLRWTSCLGCNGEEGNVVLRSDHTIAIVQR